ncbi:MAG: hypothetical protein V1839_04130, partial [archaeon]
LIVFGISTLLFASGFLLSDFLSNKKISYVDQALSDISMQTASLETEYALLLENPCTYTGFNKLASGLDELGGKLVFSSDEQSLSAEKINSIKQQYFLLEVKHLLFTKKANRECGANYTTILYFYSDKGDCEICRAQGIVLTNIKQMNPNAMIYSFDTNLDFSLVSTLKEIYRVKTAPTLVVNEKTYEGLLDQRTVLALLKQHMDSAGS